MNQAIAYEVQSVMPQAVTTGLFLSFCTVQAPDGLLIGAGQPSGAFVNIAGLTNIACMDAPSSVDRYSILAEQKRGIGEIESLTFRHILLDSYYPIVETAERIGARVLIDGAAYTLLGAESDSQHVQTRLRLQKVTL